jgi:HEAT repeat protein
MAIGRALFVLILCFLIPVAYAQSADSSVNSTSARQADDNLARLRGIVRGEATGANAHAEAHQLMKSLVEAGPSSAPSLAAVVSNKKEDKLLRCYSTMMLSQIKDRASVSALAKTALDPTDDEDVRAGSVLALSKFKEDKEAESAIEGVVSSTQSPRLRAVSLSALADVETIQATDALGKALESSDYQQRRASVVSLGELSQSKKQAVREQANAELANAGRTVIADLVARSKRAAPSERLSKDEYEWMRETVYAVARAKCAEGANVLSDIYASSTDERLRQDAVSAGGGFAGDNQARDLLTKALSDTAPKVRMMAARALLILTDGEAAAVVEKAMEKESSESVRSDMSRALRAYEAKK